MWYLFKLLSDTDSIPPGSNSQVPHTAASADKQEIAALSGFSLSADEAVTKSMLKPGGSPPGYTRIDLRKKIYSLHNGSGLTGIINNLGHKIQNSFTLFKAYPVRTTISLLTNIAIVACVPILSWNPAMLATALGLLLYQHFSGAILYFNKSMRIYSRLTNLADKSGGERFVQTVKVDAGVAQYFDLDALKRSPELKRFLQRDTGITLRRDGGKLEFRFSYAVSPVDAREFNHYMHQVIAAAEKAGAAQKTLGALESIRFMADKRATLSLAGRRQRSLANRWYFDLREDLKLNPRSSWGITPAADHSRSLEDFIKELGKTDKYKTLLDNAGWHIHDGKTLQINYLLRRADLELLAEALKTYGYDADSIEKVKIGYKIVESNFNADIAGKSWLSLPPDQRMNLAAEISTYTSMPPFVALNTLYASVHQLDTTNLRMELNLMNNSLNGHEVQAIGLGALAREVEARMNAIVELLSDRLREPRDDKARGSRKGDSRLADKQQENDLRSGNYWEMGLQLADPYGRPVTPNITLEEVIQRIFPADGLERAVLIAALYRFNLYNNIDGDKYLFAPDGRKLVVADKDSQGKFMALGPNEVSLRDLLHQDLAKNGQGVLTALQIDNFVDALIYNNALQKQAEVFASYIAKFHRTGKLDAREQNDLAVMLTNRYTVSRVQAGEIVKDLLTKHRKINEYTLRYTNADLGADKINNINADGFTNADGSVRWAEFADLVAYAKAFTLAQKSKDKPYITEVLEGHVDADKISFERYEREFGAILADWMSEKAQGSIGGIAEALRWDIESRLRRQYSYRRQQQMRNPALKNELKQIPANPLRYEGKVTEKIKLSPETVKKLQAKGQTFKYEAGVLSFDWGKDKKMLRKLLTGDNTLGDDRKTLLEIYKKYNQYVSNFKNKDERRLMYQTKILTDKTLEILARHQMGTADILKALQARAANYPGLTVFAQYKAVIEEQHEALRKDLQDKLPVFAGVDTGELIDSLLEVLAEGEVLQQATIRGLVTQTNRALTELARVNGKDIFALKNSAIATQARESGCRWNNLQGNIDTKLGDAQTSDDRKIFDALKDLLADYGGKKMTGGPNYWQLAYAEIKNSLADALLLAVKHTKNQKYKNSEHWNVGVKDLLASSLEGGPHYDQPGGQELAQNYGERTLTLLTIDKLAADKNVQGIADLLKNKNKAELNELIEQAVTLLQAEADFTADLELLLEQGHGLIRDAAIVTADMLKTNILNNQTKVNLDEVDFIRKYHAVQNSKIHYILEDKKRNTKEELFSDRIMKNYIQSAAQNIQNARAKPESRGSAEPLTMFSYFRSSPQDDQNGKPGVFNISYTGVTPFENMQKTIKTILQWHRQWDGAYTLTQLWTKFKKEQLRDTISIAMNNIYYRGKMYPFWTLLDKVFTELDKNADFQKRGADGKLAIFANKNTLDSKRNYHQKLDELFHQYVPDVLKTLAKDSEDYRALVRVLNSGKTMGERMDVSFQANMDKDNYFYNTYMSMIANVFKPSEADGSIVNETTVLVQAQQDLYFSMFNKLQQASMVDMHDFRATEAYVLGQQGIEQDQGCFNVRNRKYDTYFHLARSVLEISTPTNKKAPRLMPRILTGALPAVASIFSLLVLFQGLMLVPFLPVAAAQIAIPLAAYVLFFHFVPWAQNNINRTYRKVTETLAPFTPMMVRRTMDLSKKYSSVEDYRAKAEAIKSFLFALQSFSMQGAALAEEDFAVVVEVQFPRWNLAHMELVATEIIDAEFMRDLMDKEQLAPAVYDFYKEHFAEAAQNDKYPQATMYNLRFGSIMAAYAFTGLSIFAFPGVLFSGLFGALPLIFLFGGLSLANYYLIKRHIKKHHYIVGITRRNEKIAEDRSNAINAILAPKILNVAVSLAKMPFVSSEPVFRTMRRFFPDLYLRDLESQNYAIEEKAKFLEKLSNRTEWLRKKMPQVGFILTLFHSVAASVMVTGLQALFFGAAVLANMIFLLPSYSLVIFAALSNINLYKRVKNFITNGVIGISSGLEYEHYKNTQFEKDKKEFAEEKTDLKLA
ncbi:MAG: hypothetical protein LBD99_05255, partial [Candidatus Margulisbacteria bacterium]|nr:hypothetical protein [Candidatus Margulisiibacteriota bacterium]